MTSETVLNTVLKATGVIAFTDRTIRLNLTAQDEEHGTHQGFIILVDDSSQVELRKYRGKLMGLGEDRAVVFSVSMEQMPPIKDKAKLGALTRSLGNLNIEDAKFVDLLEVRDSIGDVGSYSACMYSPDAARIIAYISKTKQHSNDPAFRQKCTAAITDEILEGRLSFELKVDFLAEKMKFTPQHQQSMSNHHL